MKKILCVAGSALRLSAPGLSAPGLSALGLSALGLAILLMSFPDIASAAQAESPSPATKPAAQATKPAPAKKSAHAKKPASIFAKVDCSQFTRNPNGSWKSARHAMIGKTEIDATTFGRHIMMFGNEDLADVLDAKCGGGAAAAQ